MEKDIIEEAYTLKQAMTQHPHVIELEQIEAAMNQSEEVKALSLFFHQAQNRYNELLHYYPTDSHEVEVAQRDLFEAKQKLDLHPLVHQYYGLYREVRAIYQQVQDALFTPFTSRVCGGDF